MEEQFTVDSSQPKVESLIQQAGMAADWQFETKSLVEGDTTPRMFLLKSAEVIEKKGDAKLQSAKECASD